MTQKDSKPTDAELIASHPTLVSGRIYASKGRTLLDLDCTGLHALLRTLGLTVDGYYARFEGAPSGPEIVDTDAHKVTPRLLCRVEDGSSIGTFDVGGEYSNPPTVAQLRKIAASVEEAREAVLRHYQPVEILIAPAKSVQAGGAK